MGKSRDCSFARILWRAQEFSIGLEGARASEATWSPITFGSDWIADIHYYQIDIMEKPVIQSCTA